MFLPQSAGTDIVDTKGKQNDDINSVIEYIDQIVLNNHDTTPEDEDQDNGNNGQNFSYAKTVDYYHQINFIEIEVPVVVLQPVTPENPYTLPFVKLRIKDVLTPPPDQALA